MKHSEIYPVVIGGVESFVGFFCIKEGEYIHSESVNIGIFRSKSEAENFVKNAEARYDKNKEEARETTDEEV